MKPAWQRVGASAESAHVGSCGELEPIALVGLACRFPGAPDAAAFWELLCRGGDALVEVPAPRREMLAGSGCQRGGFLPDVAGFDAAFFGISAREAAEMDPQQRLMLELAWTALEDAGLGNPQTRPGPTGVFVGCMWHDYQWHTLSDPDGMDVHTATGADPSVIAARISHRLGLQGPSFCVNAACSSSLVATHLACQSLRSGESGLALAGGVNLLLSAHASTAMGRLGTLSPDARCKAFDQSADGYVRSEGAGVVVLKRLSDALKDGNPIYCLVRGSAVNHQGREEALSAPSEQGQVALLQQAHACAGVPPDAVHYVEAHGTGTRRGDPVEARALGRVLGADRPAYRALRIGSVKSNIGHLEAASGMAGLIKVALSLHRGWLPHSLHCRTPNPAVDWDALGLQVQREPQAWPFPSETALAGVNAFGFGGVNAHLVLEGAQPDRRRVVRVAADSKHALHQRLERLLRAAEAAVSPEALEALCESSAAHWSSGVLRVAAVAGDGAELRQCLEQALAGPTPEPQPERALLWVIGDCTQRWDSTAVRALLLRSPAFRRSLRQTLGAGFPALLDPLVGTGTLAPCTTTTVALQLAVHAMWREQGVTPTAVMGLGAGRKGAERLARELWPGRPSPQPTGVAGEVLLLGPHGLRATSTSPREALALLAGHRAGWVAVADCLGPDARQQLQQVLAAPCVTALEPGHSALATMLQGVRQLHAMGCTLSPVPRDGAAERWRRLPSPARRALPLPLDACSGPPLPYTLALSAATPTALRTRAQQLCAFAQAHPEVSLPQLAAAAAAHAPLQHRMALTTSTRPHLLEGLSACARGDRFAGLSEGGLSHAAAEATQGLVFLFSGHGSQWKGMGQELWRDEPAFKDSAQRCAQALAKHGVSNAAGPLAEGQDLPDNGAALQPLLFVVQMGLVSLLRTRGVEPAAVMGHSVGEIAAACTAGALSLAQAARVVAERSRAIGPTLGQGRMLYVELGQGAAQALAARHPDTAVAVHQSPHTCVLSGSEQSLAAVEAELLEQDVYCRWVAVDYASHGPQMQQPAERLERGLKGLTPDSPRIPMQSTTLGSWLQGAQCDGHYWARNLRQRVRSCEGLQALMRAGYSTFLEISPHPLLSHAVQETARAEERDARLVPCLRRDRPERQTLGEALGELFVGGYPLELRRVLPGTEHEVRLPGYPFEHVQHWRSAGLPWSRPVPSPTPPSAAAPTNTPSARPASLRQQLHGGERDVALPQVRSALGDALCRVLRCHPREVDFERSLQTLGLDSLTGLELRHQLEASLGIALSGAALWRQPTLGHVVELLWTELELSWSAQAAE